MAPLQWPQSSLHLLPPKSCHGNYLLQTLKSRYDHDSPLLKNPWCFLFPLNVMSTLFDTVRRPLEVVPLLLPFVTEALRSHPICTPLRNQIWILSPPYLSFPLPATPFSESYLALQKLSSSANTYKNTFPGDHYNSLHPILTLLRDTVSQPQTSWWLVWKEPYGSICPPHGTMNYENATARCHSSVSKSLAKWSCFYKWENQGRNTSPNKTGFSDTVKHVCPEDSLDELKWKSFYMFKERVKIKGLLTPGPKY